MADENRDRELERVLATHAAALARIATNRALSHLAARPPASSAQ